MLACGGAAHGQGLQAGEPTPTGFAITPAAAQGALFQALNPDLPSLPQFTAGQASAAGRQDPADPDQRLQPQPRPRRQGHPRPVERIRLRL
jgi:hypothetical protein